MKISKHQDMAIKRYTSQRRETLTIKRTLVFSIKALEFIEESFIRSAGMLGDNAFNDKASGLREGIDYLIRLKELKVKQL